MCGLQRTNGNFILFRLHKQCPTPRRCECIICPTSDLISWYSSCHFLIFPPFHRSMTKRTTASAFFYLFTTLVAAQSLRRSRVVRRGGNPWAALVFFVVLILLLFGFILCIRSKPQEQTDPIVTKEKEGATKLSPSTSTTFTTLTTN